MISSSCGEMLGARPYLHCDLSVVDEDFSREEISADGGFVARTELLVDLPDAC